MMKLKNLVLIGFILILETIIIKKMIIDFDLWDQHYFNLELDKLQLSKVDPIYIYIKACQFRRLGKQA